MSRYFYDGEFLEDGETIELLSIGMVAEDGREYYAINAEADLARVAEHPWLMANVVPYLPIIDSRVFGPTPRLAWDLNHPGARDLRVRQTIARDLESFIGGVDRSQHELWGFYADYDHVLLCQLWGRMVDLPRNVPMFTHDLKQLLGRVRPPQQTSGEHHALNDARWVKESWEWWQTYEKALYGPPKPVPLQVKGVDLADVLALVDAMQALPTGDLHQLLHATRGTAVGSALSRLAQQ